MARPHKREVPTRAFGRTMANDLPSRAKCTCVKKPEEYCPRHGPVGYTMFFSRHKGYYRGEDCVISS